MGLKARLDGRCIVTRYTASLIECQRGTDWGTDWERCGLRAGHKGPHGYGLVGFAVAARNADSRGGRPCLYPWDYLDIDDSFVAAVAARNMRQLARRAGRKRGHRYSIFRVPYESEHCIVLRIA